MPNLIVTKFLLNNRALQSSKMDLFKNSVSARNLKRRAEHGTVGKRQGAACPPVNGKCISIHEKKAGYFQPLRKKPQKLFS
jgi:hypothetical protein